jgi:hypothetical protein
MTQMSALTPPTGGPPFVPFTVTVAGLDTSSDGSTGTFTVSISSVPEPSTFVLGGTSLGIVVLAYRRSRARSERRSGRAWNWDK